ncbi:MAG: hypothetical protein ABW005_10475, partial [Burkholderiaceae bacterium]
ANCIAAPDQPLPTLAALEFQGGWRVDAHTPLDKTACRFALLNGQASALEGWQMAMTLSRPTDRHIGLTLLRRP